MLSLLMTNKQSQVCLTSFSYSTPLCSCCSHKGDGSLYGVMGVVGGWVNGGAHCQHCCGYWSLACPDIQFCYFYTKNGQWGLSQDGSLDARFVGRSGKEHCCSCSVWPTKSTRKDPEIIGNVRNASQVHHTKCTSVTVKEGVIQASPFC